MDLIKLDTDGQLLKYAKLYYSVRQFPVELIPKLDFNNLINHEHSPLIEPNVKEDYR